MEGLGTGKLFMGLVGDDATVKNMGVAACHNPRQLLHASSLVTKLI